MHAPNVTLQKLMPKVQLQTAVLAYLAYVDQIAFNTSVKIIINQGVLCMRVCILM